MASEGPNSPSAATTSNANGGTVDWTNPTNAEADDGSSATAGGMGTATTYRLRLSGFGFSVPAGATIDGVLVEIKRSALSAGVQDAEVQLVTSAGPPAGDDKADTGTDWPSPAAYASYGGSSDKWGLVLTDSTVNGSNFGFVIAATINSVVANVDFGRITVYYTAAPVVPQQLRQSRVFSTPVHPAQIFE